MKKTLSLFFLLMMGMTMFAQTSMETALDLVKGTNSYTNPDYVEGSWATNEAWFKHTTTEGELVSLSNFALNEYGFAAVTVNCSTDGTWNTQVSSTKSGDADVYALEGNTTYYFKATSYYLATLSFDADWESAPYLGHGKTADDAFDLVLGEELVNLPCYKNGYNATYTYVKVTAGEGNAIRLNVSSCVSEARLVDAESNNIMTLFVATTENGKEVIVPNTQPGQTYYVGLKSDSYFNASAAMDTLVPGITSFFPFELNGTTGVIPAAAGEYWYALPAQEGIAYVEGNGITLGGGSAQVIPANSPDYAQATSTDCIHVRCSIYTYATYLVKIVKGEDTAEEQTFTAVIEQNAGDDSDHPIVITDNTAEVPAWYGNTTYFYQFTTPETDADFVDVTVEPAMENDGSKILVMSGYTTLAQGKTVHAEVTPGTTYTLRVDNAEGKPVTLSLAFSAAEPGEVIGNPIVVTKATMSQEAECTRFYSVTGTKNGWLRVTANNATITFPRDNSTWNDRKAVEVNNGMKTKITEGETVIVKVVTTQKTNIAFAQLDFEAGEDISNPLHCGGVVAAGQTIGEMFYAYTVEKSGKLHIYTDLPMNEWADDYSAQTNVWYIDENGYEVSIADWMTYTFDTTIPVQAGQEVIVHVNSVKEHSEALLHFEEQEAQPGDTQDTAIDLLVGDNIVPRTATTSNPLWYKFNTTEGNKLEIASAPGYYQFSEIYAEGSNEVISQWNPDAEGAYTTYCTAPATGTYYVKVSIADEGMVIKFTDSKPAGIDSVSDSDSNGVIFNLAGQKVSKAGRGIYIINGKKVVLK